jgi:NADH-quinone oxidoreductase subunit J
MNASAFPFSDWIILLVFLFFAAATVGGALIAVGALRIIRSVCGLALCCIGLAGLFFFLNSPFLALMEVLIYVGAVCVTIIFAIMLAEPDDATPEREKKPYPILGLIASFVVAACIFFGIAKLSVNHVWPELHGRVNDGSVKAIGISLLTTYSLAFELISLVLLVAILGALAIAHGGRKKE